MRLLNRLFCELGRRFPQLTQLPLHVLAMRYYYDPAGFQQQLLSSLPAPDRAVLTQPEVADAFDRAMEEMLRQGPHGLAHDINLVAGPWVDLEKITCPVWIIHGDQDGIAPLAMAHHLRGRFPRATFEVVLGAGHLIAADVTGVLREQLKRILLTDAAGHGSALAARNHS
jgi:pimeloyl-ACP methyl ester carboxylesterase